MSLRHTAVVLTLALSVGVGLASTAHAQYFGRNKVLYRTFKTSILRTEHFDVYYYPEEKEAAEQAARMAERWYARLSRLLSHELSNRQPLILYASHTHFEQTNAIPGELEEGTGGVTESLKRRIVLPLGASLAETDHVIGHELTHAFQYDLTGRNPGTGTTAVERLPLWFIEGMAEYLSIGPVDPHTAMWMRDAAYFDKSPGISKLNDPRLFPYRYGDALWAFVGQRWGDPAVGEILRVAARGSDPAPAFTAITGMTPDSLSKEWIRTLHDLARQVPRHDPSKQARTLETAHGESGIYNLAPSVSPDGKRMIFLSERNMYNMDLFLADARTGKVLREITRSAIDSHLQSLEFVSGSGAWSPDSRTFAFSGVREGRPLITLVDAASGHHVRRIRPVGMEEVLSLSWSPDGRTLAFSALAGGKADLYTVDIASGATHRLTNDLYADLQPAWSPDGRTIAFSTERFTANIDSLVIGDLRLATYEMATGTIRALPAMTGVKHINPQWSADGRELYAVIDRGGISNVFRLHLDSDEWEQVTDVSTGVSGITRYSPAITVARQADRMLFTAYERGTYSLFSIDTLSSRRRPLGPDELPGAALLAPDRTREFALPWPPTHWGRDSARAERERQRENAGSPEGAFNPFGEPQQQPPPPIRVNDSPWKADSALAARLASSGPAPRVSAMLADPGYGRTDTSSFQRSRYRASLSLDHISQLQLGVGTTGAGVAGLGGAALNWSDMLGDHNLATYLEVSSDGTGGNFFRNMAGLIDYVNLHSRLNWGLELSQIPYITRATVVADTLTPSGPAYVQQDQRFWQIERRAAATLAYPLSRTDRIETALGYQSISFAAQTQTQLVTQFGEALTNPSTANIDLGMPRIDLGVSSLSYVHDNSYFGGTSPLIGGRSRFGIEPTIGDLWFTSVLADWRQYWMPMKPFTFAVRAMHSGRYGRDSENPILQPLFVGYTELLRGYDDGSFSVQEATGPNSVYPRLFGSRLGVFNAELRIPIVGAFGLLQSPSIPPVEITPFFDAGAAWNSGYRPHFLGPSGSVLTSHGVALRANLFGFLIGEADYVHPNDRAGKGWYWQFSLQPGF